MTPEKLLELTKKFPAMKHETGVILTPPAVLSFPHLVEPYKNPEYVSPPKFMANLVFAVGTDLDLLMQDIEERCVAKWNNNIPADLDLALKDQGTMLVRDAKGVPSPALGLMTGYESGGFYLRTGNEKRPGLRDASMRPLEPSEFYAGCIVRASIKFHAYQTGRNVGVTS
jgi:hypothetical protein